ncbi:MULTISPECIES: BamA/TamA family outer membrane protein [unclassified Carboxylicivirga]|uniref:BamA/TamA family outer membrane protein n=1 Tax=Carboxylicivirga TaxID=1628153 RepID=UPI003D352B6A
MRKLLFITLIFITAAPLSIAQKDTIGNIILNNIDSLRFAKVEKRSFKLLPYLGPSYSPETQFLLSGGGLITFKTHQDKLLNLSSVPFSVGYSSNGSFSVRALNVIYWKKDKIRTIGEFQLRNMPDNYFGVGYNNGNTIPKSDSTTAYTRNYWRFFQRVMFRTSQQLFVGAVIDINRTRAFDLNQGMQQDDDVLQDGTDIFNTGLGIELSYDTRDFVQNPYKGMFISAIFTAYSRFLGGDTRYSTVDLDYRQYKTIKRERRTLAWQVKGCFALSGSIPWTDKSMLGGLDNMRGYTMGRFRDDNMLLSTVEYRHMFKRKKLNKRGNYDSRWGYALWLGAASVAPSVNDFENWLPNAGIGLRTELQPRMNVRVDYGWAKGENGFYVTFTEVF